MEFGRLGLFLPLNRPYLQKMLPAGFDMILRFTRYHDFDYVWYIENDVKYDKKALENLWNNHKNVDDDLITWGVGGRGKKWWAWKRDTTDGDWAQAKEYTKGCLVMLCRFSKLLTHKMEEYMMRGNLTYIEIFVISLAKRENLKWSVWTKTDIGSLVPGPDITGGDPRGARTHPRHVDGLYADGPRAIRASLRRRQRPRRGHAR